jgi:hypothetical protein
LLLGSAAEGIADWRSDLDLISYHDRMPGADRIDAVPAALGATRLGDIAPWSGTGYSPRYDLAGLEIQAGHITVAAWEARLDAVLGELKPDEPWQKVLAHYQDAIPLAGADLIEAWKARIASYPEGWARAMVEHHLQVFPIWSVYDQIADRDATLWTHEMLVEGAQRVLGMLAGLNGVYWSSFQFKRAHAFEARLRWKPARLADRVDALLTGDPREAAGRLESLVAETLDLVAEHMPGIDTSRLRATIGERHRAWGP